MRGHHGCDHMVAGISTTCAISSCEFEHCSWQSVYMIQHYAINFVSDLRQVSGFLGTPVSSTNKTDLHDITEILLKVMLNTINNP